MGVSFNKTVNTFINNLTLLTLFSTTFLLAVLLSWLVNTPTYNTLGGLFLRYMSIPELSFFDWAAIIITFLISNYLISFGVVAINLIVKRERTYLNISMEIIKNIPTKTLVIFLAFSALFILNGLIQYFLVSLGFPIILASFIYLLIYLPSFYLAPAMVIEDLKPARALFSSIDHIKRYPHKLVVWLVTGIIFTYGTNYVAFLLLKDYYQIVGIITNSLLILPFLIIYQAHSYIDKYKILG